MKISDELFACYVEGTATAEQRDFVRRYLCEHPEEYERVLCLIDNDTTDYLGEQLRPSLNSTPRNEASFADIAYSAAAFAPEQNNLFCHNVNPQTSRSSELYDRMSRMCNEIDEIL